jgi:hypothetical protein
VKIVFYDINLLNLKKYIGVIIDSFISDKNNNVVIFYDEFNEEGFNYFKDKNCQVLKNRAITYRAIKKNLLHMGADMFVVNAQRLSDTAYVTVAKSLKIKTLMIQHGMYIPFMRRENFYLIKKTIKTLKYFMYSQVIAKALGLNGIYIFKDFYTTFVKGKIYKEVIGYTNSINVDNVLVYGEYWKQYHHDIFGYSLDQQYILGYHELNKVDAIKQKLYEENTVCYIAQTLVEDGRFDKHEMIKFITILSKIAITKKVYIKLHPRSDKTLYNDKNFILLEQEIPNTEYYLGHYSSLLALVGHLNGKVLLYEFKGHEIPFYFKEFSKLVVDFDELLILLERPNKRTDDSNQKEIIDNYFSKSFDVEGAVKLITKLRDNK